MGTVLGDRIRTELHRDPARRQDFLDYLEQYRGSMSEDERRDVEAALGLDIPLHERPFEELVPEDTWFHEFVTLTKDFESPKVFAFLASLVVFGQMTGSSAYIVRGGSRIWTSLSGLLISPAGEGRRSTICDFAVYGVGVPAGLPVIADSFTYEALGDTLSAMPKPEALMYAGELSTLLAKGSYGESIIPKLTDMIGKTSSFQWTTVKRGKVTFKNPCINGLFTSAPDWLAENIPAVAFGGGTWSRFLMAVCERRERFVTWTEPLSDSSVQHVRDALKSLTKDRGGDAVFHKPVGDAMEWYHEWYQEHSKRCAYGDVPDARLLPYYTRKHDHLLRLAANLALAANDAPTFTVHRLRQALDILDYLEHGMPKAYAAMALSPFAVAQRTVVSALEKAGGSLDHSGLHRRVYRQLPLASHFKEVMQSLVEMGVVRILKTPGGRGTSYLLRRRLDG